jgi:hypothetical protein
MRQLFLIYGGSDFRRTTKVTEDKCITVTVDSKSASIDCQLATNLDDVASAKIKQGFSISEEKVFNEEFAKAMNLFV